MRERGKAAAPFPRLAPRRQKSCSTAFSLLGLAKREASGRSPGWDPGVQTPSHDGRGRNLGHPNVTDNPRPHYGHREPGRSRLPPTPPPPPPPLSTLPTDPRVSSASAGSGRHLKSRRSPGLSPERAATLDPQYCGEGTFFTHIVPGCQPSPPRCWERRASATNWCELPRELPGRCRCRCRCRRHHSRPPPAFATAAAAAAAAAAQQQQQQLQQLGPASPRTPQGRARRPRRSRVWVSHAKLKSFCLSVQRQHHDTTAAPHCHFRRRRGKKKKAIPSKGGWSGSKWRPG